MLPVLETHVRDSFEEDGTSSPSLHSLTFADQLSCDNSL